MFVFFSQQFGDEVWITVTAVITARSDATCRQDQPFGCQN
ncbi:unnamed protein product [Porites lobata]|uniref:Uncharacterized protein n=1 Tax=Porites lobata TaxID=104759 RepID=A0ABN8QHQ4_9CNID|nr:unnamed protein product [Porites lobata]